MRQLGLILIAGTLLAGLTLTAPAAPLIGPLGGGLHGVRLQSAPDAAAAYAVVVAATSLDPQAVPTPELPADFVQRSEDTQAGVYVREEWDKGALLRDGFSARWTGTLNVQQAGEYTFYLTTDDGTRMTVDGETIIDAWVPRPPTTSEENVSLTASDHEVVVEYYEGGGAATAKLEWSAEGLDRQVIPAARVSADGARGWKAEYFTNTALEGEPVGTQIEPTIDYEWGEGGPKVGEEEPGEVVLEWSRIADNAIVGRVHSGPESKIVLLNMPVGQGEQGQPDLRAALLGDRLGEYGFAQEGVKARAALPPTERSYVFLAGLGSLPVMDEAGARAALREAWLASVQPNLPPDAPDADGWVSLFDGKSFDGWKFRWDGPGNWVAHDGLLENAAGATDILTEWSFADYDLHIEFTYPQGSNSGVYFQGRYEIQVADSYGRPPESHQCGALYGIQAPSENVTKPAGEWQSLDVAFTSATLDDDGRVVPARMSITHNDVLTLDDAAIPRATGGELDRNFLQPGPVMLQGTHGPVTYRNIKVRPR